MSPTCLSVAIPALVFHRYLGGKVGRLVLEMEKQAWQRVRTSVIGELDAAGEGSAKGSRRR